MPDNASAGGGEKNQQDENAKKTVVISACQFHIANKYINSKSMNTNYKLNHVL
jgi:hypothetical protein